MEGEDFGMVMSGISSGDFVCFMDLVVRIGRNRRGAKGFRRGQKQEGRQGFWKVVVRWWLSWNRAGGTSEGV